MKQVAMVGHGEGVHPQPLDLAHQLRDAVRPVEQRVFGVQMEMDEGGRHEGCGLPVLASPSTLNREKLFTWAGGGAEGDALHPSDRSDLSDQS